MNTDRRVLLKVKDLIQYIKTEFSHLLDEKSLQVKNDNTDILGITSNSKTVKQGWLFAALPGFQHDGRDYIEEAIEKGAVAILVNDDPVQINNEKISVISHANPRQLFSLLSASFYSDQPETILAVTGTNGKTSVARFCQQIWDQLNIPAASLGTLGLQTSATTKDYVSTSGSLTTPDSADLHRQLSEIKSRGVNHLAFESSSHGLDQHRVDGVKVTAAAFTNLSRDHLDYHETMEAYFEAKQRLFTDVLSANGTAVLNADIPEFKTLKTICDQRGVKVISFGQNKEKADLLISNINPDHHGSHFTLEYNEEKYDCFVHLIGEFQISNVATSVSLLLASDIKLKDIVPCLTGLKTVHGRIEKAGTLENNANVYIDYAHTPDALSTVLQALRAHTKKGLHVVFGCGGDRDQGKRSQMGEIAQHYADHIIVTDDNPRYENPRDIRKEILSSCPSAAEVPDRSQAIWKAITDLNDGDILLIAGKGHEPGQIIQGTTYPFDDLEEARSVIQSLKNNPQQTKKQQLS